MAFANIVMSVSVVAGLSGDMAQIICTWHTHTVWEEKEEEKFFALDTNHNESQVGASMTYFHIA